MGLNEKVKISVIIPVYNGEKYIRAALETVSNQTVRPYEVIIVDDGSKDKTVALIRKYILDNNLPTEFIKIVSQKNAGAGAARNTGLTNVSGEWVAFLDSDDSWDLDKIKKVKAQIAEHPECNMLAHDEIWHYIDEGGIKKHTRLSDKYDADRDFFVQLYQGNFLSTSSLVIKKQLLDIVGLFDNTLQPAEDYGLWMRLSRYGKLIFLPEPLTTYIVRNDSISSAVEKRYNAEIRICKENYKELVNRVGNDKAIGIAIKRMYKIHLIEAYLAARAGRLLLMGRIIFKLLPQLMSVKSWN